MTAQIRLSLAAPAAEIVIDAPARRNAFNTQMWAALPGLIAEAEAMQDAKVVILHGGGTGHFAAGADISEFEENRSGAEAQDYDRENARAMAALP